MLLSLSYTLNTFSRKWTSLHLGRYHPSLQIYTSFSFITHDSVIHQRWILVSQRLFLYIYNLTSISLSKYRLHKRRRSNLIESFQLEPKLQLKITQWNKHRYSIWKLTESLDTTASWVAFLESLTRGTKKYGEFPAKLRCLEFLVNTLCLTDSQLNCNVCNA